uniref:BEACH domain-containing protein n=1 Tax=Palpitomonas bilix TaxID=652834 RepID=A0A7S3DCN2_9EUKA
MEKDRAARSAMLQTYTKKVWTLHNCRRVLLGRLFHEWRAIELHFEGRDGEEGALRLATISSEVHKDAYSIAERDATKSVYLGSIVTESDTFKRLLQRARPVKIEGSSRVDTSMHSAGRGDEEGDSGEEVEEEEGGEEGEEKRMYELSGDELIKLFASCILHLKPIRDLPSLLRPTDKEAELGKKGVKTMMKRMEKITAKWKRRDMTTFEYLMHINYLAGRTFQDIGQYPVFPWVLSDYTSKELDLTSPHSYRDLAWPIGAQTEKARAEAIGKYELMREMNDSNFPPRHFGTHYSTSAGVSLFLIRMSPFTELAMEIQEGSFDVADRLFGDLPRTYEGAVSNPNDIRELIPELFYDPRIFAKANGIHFGKNQLGEELEDVRLPAWANGSAETFVRLHMMALESEHVSMNIHKWIDLIFGVCQRGSMAEKKVNLYDAVCYEDMVDLRTASGHDLQRIKSQIAEFGATPIQVFFEPHDQRRSAESSVLPPFVDLFRRDDESETHLSLMTKEHPLLLEPASLLVGIREANVLVEVKGVSNTVLVHRWNTLKLKENVEERVKSGEKMAVGRSKSLYRGTAFARSGTEQKAESKIKRFFRSLSSVKKSDPRPYHAFLPSAGSLAPHLSFALCRPLQARATGPALIESALGKRFAVAWTRSNGVPFEPEGMLSRLEWKKSRSSCPSLLFGTGYVDGSIRALSLSVDASREKFDTKEVASVCPFPSSVGTCLAFDKEEGVLAVGFAKGELALFESAPSQHHASGFPLVPLAPHWRRQTLLSSISAVAVSAADNMVVFASASGALIGREGIYINPLQPSRRMYADMWGKRGAKEKDKGNVEEICIVPSARIIIIRLLRESSLLILSYNLQRLQRIPFMQAEAEREQIDVLSMVVTPSPSSFLPQLFVSTSSIDSPVEVFVGDDNGSLYKQMRELEYVNDMYEEWKDEAQPGRGRKGEGGKNEGGGREEGRNGCGIMFGELLVDDRSELDRLVGVDDKGRLCSLEDLLKNARMLRSFLADSLGV